MSSHTSPQALILPTIDPFLRWADRKLQCWVDGAASRIFKEEVPTAEALGLALDDPSVYAGILGRLASETRAMLGTEYAVYLNHPRRGARYLKPAVASIALSIRLLGAGVIAGVADVDQRFSKLADRMAGRALRRLMAESSSAPAAAHRGSGFGGADEQSAPPGRPLLSVVRGTEPRATRMRRAIRRSRP